MAHVPATANAPAARGDFKVLVDFDSTLFNTRRFGKDLLRDIADQAGVSYEQVSADSKKFYANPILGGYDFQGHVTSYALDVESMWQHLDEIIRTTNYLYPDSAEFMQALRSDGYNPK